MSKYNTATNTALLTITLLLAACTTPVGPQESGIDTPSWWSRMTGTSSATVDPNAPLVRKDGAAVEQQWWTHYNDATLNALVAEAIANNKTLQIAKARVAQARAARGIAKSKLLPELNGVGTATRGDQGFATGDKTVGIAEADLSATWELDLFGGNQARTAAATALLQSEEATQQGVMVALLSEVARNYFDLRNYERQIDITSQNLETQKKTLELVRAQMKGALASDFDVQRAAAQVSTTAALLPVMQAAYEASLNHLNVLLGVPPGTKDTLLKTAQAQQPLGPQVVLAAPATVLATRPDVRAAERRFAASISNRRAAVTDLFPKISLTSFFGAQSATGFNSTPWGIGANLTQPVLNFGRISSQIDVADAQQQEAFLGYQQAVLSALEDMDNALTAYIHETTRNAALTEGVEQSGKAAQLAHQQFDNGYTGLLDVLVAERDLLAAQSAQSASDASLRKDLVNIYAAAGGGWDVAPAKQK